MVFMEVLSFPVYCCTSLCLMNGCYSLKKILIFCFCLFLYICNFFFYISGFNHYCSITSSSFNYYILSLEQIVSAVVYVHLSKITTRSLTNKCFNRALKGQLLLFFLNLCDQGFLLHNVVVVFFHLAWLERMYSTPIRGWSFHNLDGKTPIDVAKMNN